MFVDWLKVSYFNKIGNVLLDKESYLEAINNFDKALNIDCNSYDALLGKGKALYKFDQPYKAIDCLEEALTLKPTVDIWEYTGNIFEHLNKFYDAIRCYKNAKQLILDSITSIITPKEKEKIGRLTTLIENLEKIKNELQILPDDIVGERSWHFDPELNSIIYNSQPIKDYYLISATSKDFQKILAYYYNHPVPGHDIKSVEVIYNPTINGIFYRNLKVMQKKYNNPALTPTWEREGSMPERIFRKKIDTMSRELAVTHMDPDFPNVRLLPLWHGTKPDVLGHIFNEGYIDLASTDSGYFGRGFYSAHEAEYSYRVYSKGALIVNWVAMLHAYPTIAGDMGKLAGQGRYKNYDAHFVPVVPCNPNNPDEVSYIPCTPEQKHTYTEVVVFNQYQCLPRYKVELQPSLPKAPTFLSEEVLSEEEINKKFSLQPPHPLK